jgi:hypothetical protein
MRLNIYSQELTKEIQVVRKMADTGIVYYGIRLYLASPDILHHTPQDDDRSAITFWIPYAQSFTQDDLARLFEEMAHLTRSAPPSHHIKDAIQEPTVGMFLPPMEQLKEKEDKS